MVCLVQGAKMEGVPEDAHSLRLWLDLARSVLLDGRDAESRA